MSKERTPQPTEAELIILRILWSRGPSTVREVFEELQGDQRKGYTTVLKQLQIMHEKGLVDRSERGQSHVYRARVREASTRQRLIHSFLERTFGGTAHELVVELLSTRECSPEEIKQLRDLLERLQNDKTRPSS